MVHPAKHHQAAILPPADKRRKRGLLEENNARQCLRAVLIHPSKALLLSPFTDVEIEELEDSVHDPGHSPAN